MAHGKAKVFGVGKVYIFLTLGRGLRLVIREVSERLGKVRVSVNHLSSGNLLKLIIMI
jgi:hypothetical protein